MNENGTTTQTKHKYLWTYVWFFVLYFLPTFCMKKICFTNIKFYCDTTRFCAWKGAISCIFWSNLGFNWHRRCPLLRLLFRKSSENPLKGSKPTIEKILETPRKKKQELHLSRTGWTFLYHILPFFIVRRPFKVHVLSPQNIFLLVLRTFPIKNFTFSLSFSLHTRKNFFLFYVSFLSLLLLMCSSCCCFLLIAVVKWN